jgi:hypothetical protein
MRARPVPGGRAAPRVGAPTLTWAPRLRLASRLRAAADAGAFVPLPFLRAADAAPAALLADIRQPYMRGRACDALPLVRAPPASRPGPGGGLAHAPGFPAGQPPVREGAEGVTLRG